MDPLFWKDKRVFITGHTGFKGGWLALWLQSLGAKVTGYALSPPTEPNLFNLAHVGSGMQSIIGDIRDFKSLSKSIAAANPEVVFHLAAQPLVRESYSNPIETYSTNVMGTVNLLEIIRTIGTQVKSCINITSYKCYENQEWYWGYRENEPMGGFDPYSNSKGCSELVSAAFRASFFSNGKVNTRSLGLATARAGNVIGGGDWAIDRLIPDIIRSIEKKSNVIIRNPNAIRPWQHVLEPLSGYLLLAENLHKNPNQFAEAWNFGPSDEDAQTVGFVTDLFLSYGPDSNIKRVESLAEGPHEATFLKLDCSKARAKLGWKPKWKIETALLKTFDWYKAYFSRQDLNKATLEQIHMYQNN